MEKGNMWQGLLDWVEAVAWAAVVVILLFGFVARSITVSGSSMVPTLQDGDRLLVTCLHGQVERGDIVILNKETAVIQEPIVKRVIATEGQTVDINFFTGEVTVDGQVLEEDYINEMIIDTPYLNERMYFPLTVPEGEIFVMGDNRNASTDSRSISLGTVDERNIVGKAVLRFMPLSQAGMLH